MGVLDTWKDILVWKGTENYRWKMTDKPHVIAKQFGFSKFDEIWEDEANKNLNSSRKRPENIKKDDIVSIPPTPSERAAIKKEIVATAKNLSATYSEMANRQENIAKLLEKSARGKRKTVKSILERRKSLNKLLQSDIKQLKKWSAGVDMAKDAIGFATDLSNLAKNAEKLAKLSGKEAEKAYKALLIDTLKLSKSGAELTQTARGSKYQKVMGEPKNRVIRTIEKQLMGPGGNLISDLLDKDHNIRDGLTDTYSKLQSPSFWGGFGASLLSGKSWTESISRDFEEELKQKRARYEVMLLKSAGKYSRLADEEQKLAKNYRGYAKTSKELSKYFKSQLSKYQKL